MTALLLTYQMCILVEFTGDVAVRADLFIVPRTMLAFSCHAFHVSASTVCSSMGIVTNSSVFKRYLKIHLFMAAFNVTFL